MKKRILILSTIPFFCWLLISCMGIHDPVSQKSSIFRMNIDYRDMATVTKEKLQSASTAMDILPEETYWPANPIQSLKVTIFKKDVEFSEVGEDLTFSDAQKQLLHSLEYSESFNLRAPCKRPNPDNPKVTEYEMYYPFTVVPESEAEYPGGKDAIIIFLEKRCQKLIDRTVNEHLDPGFIVFTVSTSGKVEHAAHMISCGYPELDDRLVELMGKLPKKWQPAENVNGEKVPQELVLRFGDINGC